MKQYLGIQNTNTPLIDGVYSISMECVIRPDGEKREIYRKFDLMPNLREDYAVALFGDPNALEGIAHDGFCKVAVIDGRPYPVMRYTEWELHEVRRQELERVFRGV